MGTQVLRGNHPSTFDNFACFETCAVLFLSVTMSFSICLYGLSFSYKKREIVANVFSTTYYYGASVFQNGQFFRGFFQGGDGPSRPSSCQSRPPSATNFLRAHSRTGWSPVPRSRPSSAEPSEEIASVPTADIAREVRVVRVNTRRSGGICECIVVTVLSFMFCTVHTGEGAAADRKVDVPSSGFSKLVNMKSNPNRGPEKSPVGIVFTNVAHTLWVWFSGGF